MVVGVGSVTVESLEVGFDRQLVENEKVIDAFLSEVASFIYDDAKKTAEFIDRTENLRKSIGKRKSKFIRGGYIVKATGKNKGKGYHAHLVEFGHVKPNGGRVAACPFMRNALDRGKVFAAGKIAGMRKG